MVGAGLVSLLLLLTHFFTDWLDPVVSKLQVLTTPFYQVANTPGKIYQWGEGALVSREELEQQNAAMTAELAILKRKLQQMGALAAENVRLRQLLNSAKIISDRVLVAELVSVSPDPLLHSVALNKGAEDGVYVGQPLLDAHGLMGQVTEVGQHQSRALLITDATHALPVQVNRNGVRAVAEGVGDLYRLELRHLANTVDIREGDLLVSSGLGQRFPVGYPVAEVISVSRDPGQPFAKVDVRPKAQLNRSRHVLLVFGEEQGGGSQINKGAAGGSDQSP